jgi:hypothetical protein
MLDPRRYLEVLPGLLQDMPEGARRFAADPDHYDFYSLRCVKDLALVRQDFAASSVACTIEFAPNSFKHEMGLSVSYVDVSSFEIRMDDSTDLMSFHVLLDEILPEGGGIRHEYGLRGVTIVVCAADLEATWVHTELDS